MSGGQSRPRVLSLGSHRSHRSQKSTSSATYHGDMHETPAEKQKKVIKSKADPTLAMTEEQPSMVATSESSLGSLRAMQHKDKDGNPILDPDRSNPTRSRWERPLDTIKAFEAAIDGEYKRQSTVRGGDTHTQNGYNSRRSSYHNGFTNGTNTPARYGQENGGYHNNRPSPSHMRSEYHNDGYYSEAAPAQRSRLAQRMTPEPAYNGYGAPQSVYPSHGYHQSYETVNSGNGSHATEPWGNSTDPSSENSSMDRVNPAARFDQGENYGATKYGDMDHGNGPNVKYAYGTNVQSPLSPPQPPPHGRSYGQEPPADAGPSAPPALPPKDVSTPQRKPIKLGLTSNVQPTNNAPAAAAPPPPPEKRKSWFKRFSKS